MLALLVSGCGSTEPSASVNQLFGEYLRSTEVRNDRFVSTGSSADRMSNFAAYYTPEQLLAVLLATFECDNVEPENPEPRNFCEPSGAVERVARDVGGELHARSVLVKHDDGSLELITLYVVRNPDRALLVDPDGRTYTGLEDFRAGNELLTSEDTMLTLRDITSVPGEGEAVTVTGHTPPVWPWWLLGGGVVVVLLAAGTYLVHRRSEARAEARFDAASEA